jgi:hypothetical protein
VSALDRQQLLAQVRLAANDPCRRGALLPGEIGSTGWEQGPVMHRDPTSASGCLDEATFQGAFLRDYCELRDLSMNQVVAIGDGRSDLPMFDAAGFSVGLNASPAARAAASVSVDSHSFLDALRAVPGLLND